MSCQIRCNGLLRRQLTAKDTTREVGILEAVSSRRQALLANRGTHRSYWEKIQRTTQQDSPITCAAERSHPFKSLKVISKLPENEDMKRLWTPPFYCL